MFTRVIRKCVVVLVAGSLAGACASSGGGGFGSSSAQSQANLTPAERQMQARSESFNSTIWEGVAIGALGGALLGGLIGGDWESAAYGAAGGAVAGGLAGNYLASKQRQYSTKEAQLDSLIADARTKNQQAGDLVAALEEVVAEDRRKLVAANQKYEQGLIQQAEYESEVEDVRENYEYIQKQIAEGRKQQQVFADAGESFRTANPTVDTSAYDTEVEQLGRKIDRMTEVSEQIADPSLG